MNEVVRPLTISLHALGGQGGGVIADWLISVARSAGWLAQSTSVPGVAQRTGATVYYIELFPRAATVGHEPVLALMPTPGDIDLVIASEPMEAGRAYNRGLITDRTTLVASTSRIYAITEKSGMADGRLSSEPVLAAAHAAARRVVAFDMEAVAMRTNSVISAVLLGAVAGSNALPFTREGYETAIREAGIAVATNLAAFAAGYDGARGLVEKTPPRRSDAAEMLLSEGVKRLIDYQDQAYANLYLQRIADLAAFEREDGLLTQDLARYLALWMSYEDTVRVADLKIRSARFERVRGEVSAGQNQIVHITEYLHPRLEEICDSLPARLGSWALRTGWTRRFIKKFAHGRHVTTSSLGGFLMLYFIAAQRRWRRSTLRYVHENAKIEAWLAKAAEVAKADYEKALEIIRCQRLIKGYGDTYDRGWSNFSKIMAICDNVDATAIGDLRAAALSDDSGKALDLALALIAVTDDRGDRHPAAYASLESLADGGE